MQLNVAILHYHFNRGGVTQVVHNHLQALDAVVPGGQPVRVALIHGGRTGGVSDAHLSGFRSLDVSMHSVASLDYDDGGAIEDENLATEIRAVLESIGFSPDATLLHVHNHSLGKNVSLPGAIQRLARDGYHFLLQIHDFAEDLRPANYVRLSKSLNKGDGNSIAWIYLQAPQLHCAVLNGRDYEVLDKAGVPSINLHRLPNPAGEFGELPAKEVARKKLAERFGIPSGATYILYPVRGIRRKNVGEVLLWAAVAPESCYLGVTLAPQNPVERRLYSHWKWLANELDLRCGFETGGENGLEFKENLSAADLLVTTSVAEGFGMVFLETWLAGRNLVGRDLPEITADFVDAGIDLSNLYPQLLIPIDWVGRSELKESLTRASKHLLASYAVESRLRESTQQQLSSVLEADNIDFAMLDSGLQSSVIRKVHSDHALRELLFELNPRLRKAIFAEVDESSVAANAEVVRRVYSLEASGRRLWNIYERVMASRVETDIKPLAGADHVLTALLDVTRLHPVRFEE